MRYFDVNGNDVAIHADALAIPCFNRIWTQSKDKAIASSMIKYIVLNNHPDSPYVTSMSKEDRERKLKDELLPDINIDTEDMKYAEATYIEFLNTLPLQMLSGLRVNLEMIGKTLNSMRGRELSIRDMKDIFDLAGKAESAIKSISSLEKRVRKDEMESSKIRGGSEIGRFELPNKTR